MNWYKIALTEKDFYDFYGYSSLDFNSFEDNPKLLYEMIDHINYIRSYYLNYLIKQIGIEIDHGLSSILEFNDDGANGKYDEFKIKILELSKKFKNNSFEFLTQKDFDEAYNIFNDFIWDPVYGGDAWAEITKWTKKLWQAGKVEYRKYNQSLFNQIYKIIMAIDTIHSLEHNTGSVLSDLPERESHWMSKALEMVKNSKLSYNLIPLLESRRLKEQLTQNRMMIGEKYDPMINNAYRDFFQSFFDKLKNKENYEDRDYRFLTFELTGLEINQIKILFDVILKNLEDFEFESNKLFYRTIFNKLAYNEIFITNLDLFKKALYTAQKVDKSNDLACLFVKFFTSNLLLMYRYNPEYIKSEIIEYAVDWIKNKNCSIPEENKIKLFNIYNWG